MTGPKVDEAFIKQQEETVRRVDEALRAGAGFLQEAADALEDSEDDIDAMHLLQMVLQYRLDSRDLLKHLLRCHASLLQILGVSAQNSDAINSERLAYALGSDDLHQLLLMLNQLLNQLLQLAKHEKLTKEQTDKKRRKYVHNKVSRTERALSQALDRQKAATTKSAKLDHALHYITGQPVVGALVNHIAKLEGPISHVFQAERHGMVVAAGLHQQLSKHADVKHDLAKILNKAHQLTSHVGHEKPRLFEPSQTLSSERINERAQDKRLGQFFHK